MPRTLDGLRQDLRMLRNRGSFVRNAMVTFSGVLVTVVSQLLLTPLIARIYGPEAYGVYGIFIALHMNLGLLATGGYNLAFVLPASDARFRDLFRGTVLLVVLFTTVVALLVPLSGYGDVVFPGLGALGPWVALVPVAMLLNALSLVGLQAAARFKAFNLTAAHNGGLNAGMRGLHVLLGWATGGAVGGLIVSELFARLVSLVVLLLRLRRNLRPLWAVPDALRRARLMLVSYRRYPRYVLPARWISMFSGQMPLFILAAAGATATAGQYAMATALLLVPVRLFGYSMHAVFLQKAAETLRVDRSRLPAITGRLFDRLAQMGIVPFAVLMVFGDVLFGLVLGEAWRGSGMISALLGAWFLFRVITEPMQSLFSVLGQEKRLFGLKLAGFVLGTAAMLTGTLLLEDTRVGLALFGAVNAALAIYLAARILRLSGAAWSGRILRTLGALVAAVALLGWLRMAWLGGGWWSTW